MKMISICVKNNYVWALLFSVSLVSCGKEQNEPQETPDEAYRLQSIHFSVEAGDGLKTDSITVYSREFSNRTSILQTPSIEVPEQQETSQFTADTKPPEPFRIVDSTRISIPVSLDGTTVTLGTKKWTYPGENPASIRAGNQFNSGSFSVYPHTVVQIKIQAIQRTLTTSYTAIYAEKTTGKQVQETGKWQGTRIDGYFISGTALPIP